MGLIYDTETLVSCREELEPLIVAHWGEVCDDKEVKRLKVNWNAYQQMEDAGVLKIFTAREDGDLVGYCDWFLQPHLHYMDTMTGYCDALFLDPRVRGSLVGYRLMKQSIEVLEDLGADVLIVHMKVLYPFRRLLESLDFTLTEENWERIF